MNDQEQRSNPITDARHYLAALLGIERCCLKADRIMKQVDTRKTSRKKSEHVDTGKYVISLFEGGIVTFFDTEWQADQLCNALNSAIRAELAPIRAGLLKRTAEAATKPGINVRKDGIDMLNAIEHIDRMKYLTAMVQGDGWRVFANPEPQVTLAGSPEEMIGLQSRINSIISSLVQPYVVSFTEAYQGCLKQAMQDAQQ